MNKLLALPFYPFYLLGRYKILAVVLLILVISVSPRIFIKTISENRALELRYEDFLLVFILVSCLLYLLVSRQKIYKSVLFKPIILYLFLAFVSTSFGILAGYLQATKAFFYLLKEIQYFLIFFIVINAIKNYKNLKTAIFAILIAGLLNGIYVFYQIFSGKFLGYYSIASIGETNSFPAGGYFTLISIITLVFFFFSRQKIAKIFFLICFLSNFIGLIGSSSRANILGIITAFFFWMMIILKRKKIEHFFIIIFFIFLLVLPIGIYFHNYFLRSSLYARHLINLEHGIESFYERVELAYKPALKSSLDNPIFGLGKSITGTNNSVTEAHNHYLRIYWEMGVIGLIAFLYLLLSILKKSLETYRKGESLYIKAAGLCCFLCTISLMTSALVQDAFTPVRVNEPYWIIVGLMIASYKINFNSKLCEKKSEF